MYFNRTRRRPAPISFTLLLPAIALLAAGTSAARADDLDNIGESTKDAAETSFQEASEVSREIMRGIRVAPDPAAAEIRAELEKLRSDNGLPALGAGAIRNGRIRTYMTGVRKLGDATPALTSDQFHLGSDTKAMTSTLLAVMIERGMFTWKSTLGELLPELARGMHPAFRGATLEMLTSHHAGVEFDGKVHADDAALWGKLWNENLDVVEGRKMVARLVLGRAPKFTPGQGFRYDNANYIIAGAILERATRMPWETLMQRELFAPLGMRGCGFGMAGDKNATHPTQPWGHNQQPSGLLKPVFGDNPRTLGPAGTVHCPMASWLRFIQLHIDGPKGLSKRVLTQAQSFVTLHTAYPGHNYTPGGWGVEQRSWGGTVFTHGGSNTSNLAIVWFSPQKSIGFVGVSNYAGPTAGKGVDGAIGLMIRKSR